MSSGGDGLDVTDQFLGEFLLVRQPSIWGYGKASWEVNLGCNYKCKHCYLGLKVNSGMPWEDKRRCLDIMAEAGVLFLQVTGGEPTLHPQFAALVNHALACGLDVQVYSNLYRVRQQHWWLFERAKVSLATSYYSDRAQEHERVTGRQGSHAATRANIVQAVQSRIPLQVGIVEVFEGQRTAAARQELLALGVVRPIM
ncbi:radical SAM protein [Streptomyces sp. Marseille-Q5077]|uniref:radical SAM protein n=1 Tax=Streptomyces sp. Marseille-Q5077 TaxID=3418995 RepID=UPI003D064BE7